MRFIDKNSLERLGFKALLAKVETYSAYGKEKLNDNFFYQKGDEEKLEKEFSLMEKINKFLQAHKEVILELESKLHCLKNIRNLFLLAENTSLDVVDLCEIKVQLMTFNEINQLLKSYADFFACFVLSNFDSLLTLLDPRKENIKTFYIYEEYSDKLKQIRREKKEIEKEIFSIKDFNKEYERLSLLKEKRLNIVVEEENEEAEIRKKLSLEISKKQDTILENIEKIAHLDFVLAKLRFAKNYGGVKPEIIFNKEKDKDKEKNKYKDKEIEIELDELINIELKELLERNQKRYTPISISLKAGTTVITGANMGGKSVALKTITENILLFHKGFYPLAKRAKLALLDFIFFVSDDMQDISKGLSTFGSEIMKLKEVSIFMDLGSGLVVFDEFARGTNPGEAQKFIRALIKYLNSKKSISLLTTHFDAVWDKNTRHYQVVGLKNIDFNSLKNKLAGKKNSIELIQEYMDFSLEEVNTEIVPKDALNIAKLIGLNDEITRIIDKEYKEED